MFGKEFLKKQEEVVDTQEEVVDTQEEVVDIQEEVVDIQEENIDVQQPVIEKGSLNRNGDYKQFLRFMSSHKKRRVLGSFPSEVSQSDVDTTNLKYLVPSALEKGLIKIPMTGYVDQSMLDNNDLAGSYLDAVDSSSEIEHNYFSKEKTEKKENEKAVPANKDNSQGTADDGGLA